MNGGTIRRNDGTHPVVERVYAFDPAQGIAVVLLKWSDGGSALKRVDVHELEALTASGSRADVRDALAERAERLLVREA